MKLFTRKITILLLFTLVSGNFYAQNLTRRQYIDKYKDIAIKQMHKYHIPASITLAQGCLESGNGNSTLAVKARNHFGIKCHSGWKGKKFRHNDDRRRECFRKYDSPEESYLDHALFLTGQARYRSLFDLPVTDYKAWAHGLKAAGYATNPKYAKLLIDIIEEYQLYRYDRKPEKELSRRQQRRLEREQERIRRKEAKKAARLASRKGPEEQQPAPINPQALFPSAVPAVPAVPEGIPQQDAQNRKDTTFRMPPLKDSIAVAVPDSLRQKKDTADISQTGQSAQLPDTTAGTGAPQMEFVIREEPYDGRINGVSYVVAREGDTYASIAKAHQLFTSELLAFNDIENPGTPKAGDILFIEKKKSSAETDVYRVKKGDTLRSIAQRFGIRLECLYLYNGLRQGEVLAVGRTLKLRK